MNRRSIIIVLAALVVVAVIVAAWLWLFSQGSSISGGLFGTGGTKGATTTATGVPKTNVSSTVPAGNTSATGGGTTNVPLTGGSAPGPYGVGPGQVASVPPVESVGEVGTVGVGQVDTVPTVPGVEWLGGTGGTGGTGTGGSQTTNFAPSTVNQLNSGAVGGQVSIFGTGQAGSNNNQYGALFAAAGIGTALCTAGLLQGAGLGALLSIPAAAVSVKVDSTVANMKSADEVQQRFLDCITRTIGRAIVDQITASVVNWINSGFNGSPSFVQNYQQFFANVADQAAGEYIKGSALSFLCSPFQLQVRIAIAQSYARRYSGASCSLSQVVGNVTNFINGNFSAGGWPGLISFTSVPTNNPYGAYAYAQIGLNTAQSRALQTANKNITPGGFISYVQAYDCKAGTGQNGQLINNSSLFLSPAQSAAGICPSNCKCKTATPGSIIESSLVSTQNSTLQQLNLAKNFDEIVSALITQLMTRTLQQGLSNLSGSQGYQNNFLTPEQTQAQNEGNAFLTELQAMVVISQQYGQTEQGSVNDLQVAQSGLATLLNCWELAGKSAEATSTKAAIISLESQVALHNNNILRANASITALQQLQTQTLGIASGADLARVKGNYQAALASGALITQSDLTLAQQNRTTLQTELATRNQQTAAALTQCRGLGAATTTP